MTIAQDPLSERALILAPIGRDAALAQALLAEAGVQAVTCSHLHQLPGMISEGAGLVILAEEALRDADLSPVSRLVASQPPWSDLTFVLLTRHGGGAERIARAAWLSEALGNVTFLERPFHPTTLVSVVYSALRGRRRQYEARARLEELRQSEEQQRLTVELVPAMLWWTDPEGSEISTNQRWKFYTGQQDAAIENHSWLDAMHPDELETTRTAFAQAFATGEPIERQQRIRRSDGEYRWHLVRQIPVRDDAGAITRWFGAAIDIDDLRGLQERQQVLVAELQHRTRNLMGVVRSLLDRTLRRSADLADFRSHFSDRLAALARVQSLLSRLNEGERITFDELIRSEMAALEGEAGRVTLKGPTGIALRSSTVQTFAMALHELATNAVKYGAFSQPQGRLEIRWGLEWREDSRPWLHLDWRERGVVRARLDAPQPGGGAGRDLIERALPYQLGAKTTFVMEEDGVHCSIRLPVSMRQAVDDSDDP